MRATHPFDPIVFPDSRVLILGTFPSLDSFKYRFYYAHPRNQFWRLLGTIYDMAYRSREERVEILRKNRLALWDVIKGCERTNSLDSNLKACTPNDIPALLEAYPDIERILFTGVKAQTLFERFFKEVSIETKRLPSPSPAYAAMTFEEKLKRYEEALLG